MSNQTLDPTPDTQPLTNLCDNPTQLVDQLKTTHRPITLTIDGKPEVVIQEASEYERMLDLLEAADVRDATRRGLDDVEAGRTRPAEEFFEEMRQKYAIPR